MQARLLPRERMRHVLAGLRRLYPVLYIACGAGLASAGIARAESEGAASDAEPARHWPAVVACIADAHFLDALVNQPAWTIEPKAVVQIVRVPDAESGCPAGRTGMRIERQVDLATADLAQARRELDAWRGVLESDAPQPSGQARALVRLYPEGRPLSDDESKEIAAKLDELSLGFFEHHDAEGVLRETFPRLVELMGGRDASIERMRETFRRLDASHVHLVSHTSHPAARTTDAQAYEVVLVQEDGVTSNGVKQLQMTSYSLAIRAKPAGPWTFVSAAGFSDHPDLLRELVPGLPADFKVPAESMRPL
jgi:hypothetical protein